MTRERNWVIFLPAATINLAARKNISRLNSLLKAFESPVLLNLGSGERFIGMEKLEKPIARRMVNLDLFPSSSVHVVGDAHALPFGGGVFHGIVCQALLEHTRHPDRVVMEMSRILKKGGFVYAEVPFLQGYHPTPGDFYRYTLDGIEVLFSEFEKVDSGVCVGPGSSLSWILREFIIGLLTNFSPGKRWKTPTALIAGWLTFPVKYLDFFLARAPNAHAIASGLYFLGRKV
jgi:SAM-dependent methyltransferase